MNFHTITALDPNTATKQDHSDRDYIRDDKGFAIRVQGHYTVAELEQAIACLKEANKEFEASVTPARRVPAAARALAEAASQQAGPSDAEHIERLINADIGEPLPKWATAALKGYSITRAELAPVLDAARALAKAVDPA